MTVRYHVEREGFSEDAWFRVDFRRYFNDHTEDDLGRALSLAFNSFDSLDEAIRAAGRVAEASKSRLRVVRVATEVVWPDPSGIPD